MRALDRSEARFAGSRLASVAEEGRRTLAEWDTPVAEYTRDGVTRTVRLACTTPSRAAILRLRETHYRQTLAGLGVAVWDGHDETAVHLWCEQDDELVGSLRVTPNQARQGDVYEDFERIGEVLGDDGDFLSFARELVVPARRGTEVATALAHAACLWWRARSPVRRIVFTGLVRPGRPAAFFGATELTPPLPLGPAGAQVVVCAAWLDSVLDLTANRLERTGWRSTARSAR